MPMQVFATLPQVTITKKGSLFSPHPKFSIYFLALASDMNSQSKTDLQTLQELGLSTDDKNVIQAAKYLYMSVSPPFENITADHPIPLLGDGFILYPPNDPNGALSIYVAIVQSAEQARHTGQVLQQVFSDSSVQDGFSKIEQAWQEVGKISTTLLFGLIQDAGKAVGNVMAQSNDKILFSSLFSGLAVDNYSGSQNGTTYPMGNDDVQAVMKVWAQQPSQS
jgi:hypothetical protein